MVGPGLLHFTEAPQQLPPAKLWIMIETQIVEVEPCFCLFLAGSCQHEDLGDCVSGLYERLIEAEPEAELIEAPRVYYTTFTEEGVTIEAAFPVEPSSVTGQAASKTYPGGQVLMGIHNGSYANLHESWGYMWKAFGALNVKQRGDCWDSYVTDPNEEPDPSMWVTELCIPIELT